MFEYRDARGAIGIDFARGCVKYLESGGKILTAQTELPLFALRLRMPSCEAVQSDAFQGKLTAFSENESGAAAEYAFDGFEVGISVCFGGENWAAWRMRIENHTEGAAEWVDFPQIPLIREAQGRKASFYWPYNEGVQVDDIDLRETSGWGSRDPEFPGEGSFALFPGMVESQFVAYELEGGVYLGAHDEKRGLKNIDFLPLDGCVRLKMRVYAGGSFGEDYRTDFDVVTDLFSGGWTEAAEIYRRWHEKHLPEGLKPVGENAALPEWYGDSPVVITYPVRGLHDMDDMQPNRLFPYENALPVIDRLAEKMNSRVMVLLMHWEGTAPWAPPFVWPPYGGEEMLRGFIDKLHARGHILGVYLSGVGFTRQSNLIAEYNCEERIAREGYARSFCLSPEGELLDSKICTGQRQGYDLCPMGADTADIVCGEVASMAAAGIDYAQILDQNHGGNPYFCYSRDHGHAPTPGVWMTESMQSILKKARETAPNMVFGCESAAGEPYIPHLMLSDNRFNLGWMYGKPVPMFAWVYHEYLNNFMGNQVCAAGTFEPDPESLAYRLAYSFAAGDLPTLVLTDDGRIMQAWGDRQFDLLPDEEQTLTLVKNMTALRRGEAKKYLCGGRMLKPHPVTGAGERVFAMKTQAKTLTADRVLSSRWQAADGTTAQLLVNWTKEDIRCECAGRSVLVPAMNGVLVRE